MGYRWRRFWRRLRLARPSPKLILAAAGLFLLWAAVSLGKNWTVDFEAYRVRLAEKVMEGWFPASQYGIKDSVFAFCEPILFRYLARQEAGQVFLADGCHPRKIRRLHQPPFNRDPAFSSLGKCGDDPWRSRCSPPKGI